jgi:hypothetical protein
MALKSTLKGKPPKAGRTLEMLGCSLEYFKQYLEERFQPGMSWENRDRWHIDHILPCASFDLADTEQQRKCFHYTNMQPLWAGDNMKKSDSLPEESLSG